MDPDAPYETTLATLSAGRAAAVAQLRQLAARLEALPLADDRSTRRPALLTSGTWREYAGIRPVPARTARQVAANGSCAIAMKTVRPLPPVWLTTIGK
jgi:hypothetical protein